MKAHEEMEKKRHEEMEKIMKERDAAMQKLEKGEMTHEEFGKLEESWQKREMKLHEPPADHGDHGDHGAHGEHKAPDGKHPAPAPHDHSDPNHKH